MAFVSCDRTLELGPSLVRAPRRACNVPEGLANAGVNLGEVRALAVGERLARERLGGLELAAVGSDPRAERASEREVDEVVGPAHGFRVQREPLGLVALPELVQGFPQFDADG